jgi:hypothetical protein
MSVDFERIRRDNPLYHVAARYCTDLKERGGKYWCLCPFHDDHRATNFNIYRARDGEWRFRCFACGEHGDVIDFIALIEGIEGKDAINLLDSDHLPDVGTVKLKKPKPDATVEWEPIIPVPDDAPNYDPSDTFNPLKSASKNYDFGLRRLDPYFTGDGALICWVARVEFDDGVKICPTITFCRNVKTGEKRWCARRMDPPYPLQGLDDLAANPDAYIILVEGEKVKSEIDNFLSDLIPDRFVVMTWLGGTNAVENVDWSPLEGKKVTYWEDADGPGRKAMNYAGKQIEKAGTG